MKKLLYNNGLSIVFFSLFVVSLVGQIFFGIQEHNKELIGDGANPDTLSQYLTSGHFLQSTFENFESEFLQMGFFVWFTIFLRQKGSSESKSCDEPEEVDREPSPLRKDAPWPVRRGGIWLAIYKNSLTLALFFLFLISFILHIYGSMKDENLKNSLEGKPLVDYAEYLTSSRLWFESLQNWQSEFLSVLTMVVLSIFLRQKGSPQSKPVDAADDETGEG
ncbi:MAG: hypothetical protein RLZZ306_1701 [Bacteroidota bacterium]|jgi:hypothetical protein